jgi:Pvc16 N-terminal domain
VRIVIHEIDETLRGFVRRDALPGNQVEVVFDAPTKEWASRRNSPAVDLYLYDIREDMRRRHFGEITNRDDRGVVLEKTQPPRWFKLSYLITAWTQRAEDEHRLLSTLLGCFLRRDSLPIELLTGSLGEMQAQVPYTCALPPPEDRALSDVWSALGGELKPSLDLVLIAPFDLSRSPDFGPPVQTPLGIDLSDGAARDLHRFAGAISQPGKATAGQRAPSKTTTTTTTTTTRRRTPAKGSKRSDS